MQDSVGPADEASLIRSIQSGTAGEAADAFEVLFRLYNPRLLRYLANKRLSPQEGEEAADDAWMRAWRRIGSYQYRGISFFSWLRRIADFVTLERFKHRYLGLSLEELEEQRGVPVPDEDAESEPLRELTRQEIAQAIDAALQEAPEDYRLVVEATFLEELTTEEIMELYEWSKSKVYTTKFRAISWLRTHLSERYGQSAVDAWLHEP